jgi:hypothetical protein
MHIIEGMYKIADLSNLKDILPLSHDPTQLLRWAASLTGPHTYCHMKPHAFHLITGTGRVRKDPRTNEYVIFRKRESEPIMYSTVLQADEVCRPRIIVHVVDRIMYPLA